jgi:hypothetical protein
MQINPMSEEFRGYKKVAESSSTGTYSQKLLELKTAFNNLTLSQKLSAKLECNNSFYTCAYNDGIFFSAGVSSTTTTVDVFRVDNGNAYRSQNGTITDRSGDSDTRTFTLYAMDI